jgi:Mrp family chromosome partitioning ATPase
LNKEQVISMLDRVVVPGTGRSLVKMNLVRDIRISDENIDICVASTGLIEPSQKSLKQSIQSSLDDSTRIKVTFENVPTGTVNQIGKVIAVMSGKGGVGKSLVAGLSAIALRRRGLEVGILDADITGPSIPKMFGVQARPSGTDSAFLPPTSRSGIELMSINLLLASEDDAVVWRGPLIGQTITQFWEEAVWGKLDYLIVDLPPGTSDAPLTVMQRLPVSGIIMVFTPQKLTAMVVKKAVNMARHMEKPILGVLENMSYLYVPQINKRMNIFGESHAAEMAQSIGAPLLAQLPIDPELALLCDEGRLEQYMNPLIEEIGKGIVESNI